MGTLFCFSSPFIILSTGRRAETCIRHAGRWGYLVVAGGRWIPGDVDSNLALKKEMAEFGTLENPFSQNI